MKNGHHEPIYRPILRDAFRLSWQEKRLWVIALFAGILLSGSVYDVIWRGLNALAPQASILSAVVPFWQKAVDTWSGFTAAELVIGSLNALLLTAFFLLIVFALFSSSVIAQSTLVYSIGTQRRGKLPALKDALTVGARALWPVFVLNIVALTILWATRALIAIIISLVVTNFSPVGFLLYIFGFIVFVTIGAMTVIIQLFALNAMILQGATLAQGIERGYEVLKKHWVTAVETAAILLLISIGAYLLTIAVSLLLAIPYGMLLIASVLAQSGALFVAVTAAFIFLFIILVLGVFAFTVQLHYTTWTLMYRRLGEGGILPKLHRIARRFIHGTHVPGS